MTWSHTTDDEQTILIEQNENGRERCEVVCRPFEADDPECAGERYLAIYWNGEEESFAVLKPDHAAHLARLLVGTPAESDEFEVTR
jgi:hypothetical protein